MENTNEINFQFYYRYSQSMYAQSSRMVRKSFNSIIDILGLHQNRTSILSGPFNSIIDIHGRHTKLRESLPQGVFFQFYYRYSVQSIFSHCIVVFSRACCPPFNSIIDIQSSHTYLFPHKCRMLSILLQIFPHLGQVSLSVLVGILSILLQIFNPIRI